MKDTLHKGPTFGLTILPNARVEYTAEPNNQPNDTGSIHTRTTSILSLQTKQIKSQILGIVQDSSSGIKFQVYPKTCFFQPRHLCLIKI